MKEAAKMTAEADDELSLPSLPKPGIGCYLIKFFRLLWILAFNTAKVSFLVNAIKYH